MRSTSRHATLAGRAAVAVTARLAALAVIALLAATGCGNNSGPTTPPANTLALLSITPPAGTRLAPGSTVTFNATLAFTLATASVAELTLVIEDQNGRPLNVNVQPTSILTSGQGQVNLPGTFTLPGTGVTELQVIYILNPAVANSTVQTTAVALYPVGT